MKWGSQKPYAGEGGKIKDDGSGGGVWIPLSLKDPSEVVGILVIDLWWSLQPPEKATPFGGCGEGGSEKMVHRDLDKPHF